MSRPSFTNRPYGRTRTIRYTNIWRPEEELLHQLDRRNQPPRRGTPWHVVGATFRGGCSKCFVRMIRPRRGWEIGTLRVIRPLSMAAGLGRRGPARHHRGR